MVAVKYAPVSRKAESDIDGIELKASFRTGEMRPGDATASCWSRWPGPTGGLSMRRRAGEAAVVMVPLLDPSTDPGVTQLWVTAESSMSMLAG
jgi:hypothetical protein